MTTAMDDSIGEAIRIYKENGFWENTILIFSSDNGGTAKAGGYNTPLRWVIQTLIDQSPLLSIKI